MKWLKRFLGLVCISLFALVMWTPDAKAESKENELIKVTVNVIIENPKYFWKYPFWGKQLDGIRVSALGKSFNVQPTSNGRKIEFEVPKDYKFRVSIGLESDNATIKEMNYVTKRGINEKTGMLDITLKAPETQPIIVTASTLDEILR